jgi:hypothetical protein
LPRWNEHGIHGFDPAVRVMQQKVLSQQMR